MSCTYVLREREWWWIVWSIDFIRFYLFLYLEFHFEVATEDVITCISLLIFMVSMHVAYLQLLLLRKALCILPFEMWCLSACKLMLVIIWVCLFTYFSFFRRLNFGSVFGPSCAVKCWRYMCNVIMMMMFTGVSCLVAVCYVSV